MRIDRLRPSFVTDIPECLEPGVLYMALEYDAMAHVCACGCGNEIATPIGPTDWNIAWNGVGLTVRPSVGNGSLPCRSHYLIDSSRVVWLPPMTDGEIVYERVRTARAKGLYHEPAVAIPAAADPPSHTPEKPKEPWIVRNLKRLFLGR